MARFGATLSIQSLAENVRAQMRGRDVSARPRTCLGCGQPIGAREHGVRVAGGVGHAECALYRRRAS